VNLRRQDFFGLMYAALRTTYTSKVSLIKLLTVVYTHWKLFVIVVKLNLLEN
jgi:hypothetical protein